MKTLSKSLFAIASIVGIAGVSVAACSSSTSSPNATGPCNTDPFSCPAGQVCWIKPGNSYACLTSGSHKKGDPCMPIQGSPDCADGLFCLQTAMAPIQSPVCRSLCDPSTPGHACATGETCTPTTFDGVNIIYVCIENGLPSPDGGSDGGQDAIVPPADAGNDGAPAEAGDDGGNDAAGDGPGE
jgi:hypothetical protein